MESLELNVLSPHGLIGRATLGVHARLQLERAAGIDVVQKRTLGRGLGVSERRLYNSSGAADDAARAEICVGTGQLICQPMCMLALKFQMVLDNPGRL